MHTNASWTHINLLRPPSSFMFDLVHAVQVHLAEEEIREGQRRPRPGEEGIRHEETRIKSEGTRGFIDNQFSPSTGRLKLNANLERKPGMQDGRLSHRRQHMNTCDMRRRPTQLIIRDCFLSLLNAGGWRSPMSTVKRAEGLVISTSEPRRHRLQPSGESTRD